MWYNKELPSYTRIKVKLVNFTVNCGCCWAGRPISIFSKFGYVEAGWVLGVCTIVMPGEPRKWGFTRIFCLGIILPVGGMALLLMPAMLRPNGTRLPMRGKNSGRCCMPGSLKRPGNIGLAPGRTGADCRSADRGIRRRPLCCWFCMNMSIFCWSSWLTSDATEQAVCSSLMLHCLRLNHTRLGLCKLTIN